MNYHGAKPPGFRIFYKNLQLQKIVDERIPCRDGARDFVIHAYNKNIETLIRKGTIIMRYINSQRINSARLNCAGSDTKIIPSYELEEAYNWLAEQLGTDELNAIIVKQLGSWNCYRSAFYRALLKADKDYGWHMAIEYMYEQKHMPPKEIYDDILDRSYMQRDYGTAGVDAAIVKSLTRQGLTEMLSLVIKRTVGVAAWRAYESKSIPTENQYGMDELTEAGDLYDWLTTQWKPTYINKSLIKGLRNDVLYACILDVATENDFVDMERYGNARTAYQYLVEILGEDELNAAIVRHLSKHMSEDELREDLYQFLAVHNLREAWWDYSKVTRQKMNSSRRRPLNCGAINHTYTGAAKKTLEQLTAGIDNVYINKIYYNKKSNVFWWLNSKNYLHAYIFDNIDTNVGKFKGWVEYMLTDSNTLKDTGKYTITQNKQEVLDFIDEMKSRSDFEQEY